MRARVPASLVVALAVAGCGTYSKKYPTRTERMHVDIRLASGTQLPGANDPPLPLPQGTPVDVVLDIEARHEDGSLDKSFTGFVRVSSNPGSVVQVTGQGAAGRNAFVKDGVAHDQHVIIDNPRGPTRLWIEDIGYTPADPFKPPACADGKDNDGDGNIDYPQDPGCAFANDDSETPGQFAAGVSKPIYFALPRLSDVQGHGAATPYPEEGVEVMTDKPARLIVTRVAAQGFYTTDVTDTGGYNHIFAFTFSTPGGIRVCDRVTQLSGTSADFFGFTELSFPSYEILPWRNEHEDGKCQVPDPQPIDSSTVGDSSLLEEIESALVRVADVKIGADFGPKPAINNVFGPDQSNCDLDNNGTLDFNTPGSPEAACANACVKNPECVEWTGYVSRGNYRVNLVNGGGSIQINTSSVAGFDPVAMKGQTLPSVTGTLRNFSGGSLNWTIETRCLDDLVCGSDATSQSQLACRNGPKAPVASDTACVSPRTIYDPNEATN